MTDQMTRWISEHALRITTVDVEEPLTDLRRFVDMVGDASVVALGASSRLTHELSAVAHRLVRLLVEEHGFRSLVMEGDDAASAALDLYLRTGEGDPADLLANARSFWRTQEIFGLITWMRAYNLRHPDDPVRVVHPAGAESETGRVAIPDTMAGIERAMATNTLRWHDETGHKIVYWGGVAHTSVRDPAVTHHPTAGTLMKERLGHRYVSVGLTFHHGSESDGVPAPPADFVEAVLGNVGIDAYFLDLRTDAPGPVRAWLDAPVKALLIGPRYDSDVFLHGGSLAEWFDIVVHITSTTPGRPAA